MLVLLPPSERKAAPFPRARPLDLESLSFPSLTEHRERVLGLLVRLAQGPASNARAVLKLSEGQTDEIARNAGLFEAGATRVADLYTGILYEALGLDSMSAAGKRRATQQIVVASSLFGALRLTDRVPAYRLSGGVTLPRLGPIGTSWQQPLATALPEAAGRGLVLDLRSSAYSPMWQATGELAERAVTVRVLHERVPGDASSRAIVSHFNKATKGRIVRDLLESGARPRSINALTDVLAGQDRVVELHGARPGKPRAIDVIVRDV